MKSEIAIVPYFNQHYGMSQAFGWHARKASEL